MSFGILLSGGMDSAALAYWKRPKVAFTINYGQVCAEAEIQAASQICKELTLLEPRRLTVAVSRPRCKFVVISSRVVFDLIPADLDEYERGALWKHLRHECSESILWEGDLRGQHVTVRALKC